MEWIFAFPGRISVTISAADRLVDRARDELAKSLEDVAAAPTFRRNAAVADRARAARHLRGDAGAGREASRRRNPLEQSVLAGDWTATGLPATIEGAIRSGNGGADLVAWLP